MSLFDDIAAFRAAQDANVQDTRDSLFSGLRNETVVGTTPADTLAASQDISALTTQVAATANRLDATLTQVTTGGGGGGNDQFTRVGSDLGADWTVVDSATGGALSTNGAAATWTPSGSSVNWAVARSALYTPKTDYQVSRIVLAEPLNTTSGWLLFTRMDTAQTSYSYGLVRKNYREIGYVNAGTKTVLVSSTDPYDPPPGTAIDLRSGLASGTDVNVMQLNAKSSVPGLLTSLSTAPLSGSSYRNFGFGADIKTASGAQISPGAIDLWTGYDFLSPPVVGVFFSATPSGTKGAPPSSGNGDFLADTFDNVTAISDYLTYSSTTNTLTVQLPGAYLVTINVRLGSAVASGDVPALQIFVNEGGTGAYTIRGASTFATALTMAMSQLVYLNAGDTVTPSYSWTGTPRTILGSNPSSRFLVAKLSPPYFA